MGAVGGGGVAAGLKDAGVLLVQLNLVAKIFRPLVRWPA